MSDIKKKLSVEVRNYWNKKHKPLLFSTIGDKFKEIKSEEKEKERRNKVKRSAHPGYGEGGKYHKKETENPLNSDFSSIDQFCLHTKNGGARRDRTDDLKLAKLALSQLSYGPNSVTSTQTKNWLA